MSLSDGEWLHLVINLVVPVDSVPLFSTFLSFLLLMLWLLLLLFAVVDVVVAVVACLFLRQ